MDYREIKKTCLVNTHTSKNLNAICIDRDCKQKSRSLCSQCMTRKIHRDCTSFISILDLQDVTLDLEYVEDSKIFQVKQYLIQSQKEIFEKIENQFEGLKRNISQKIDEIKKKCKVEVIEKQNIMKKKYKGFVDRFGKINKLDEVQKQIQKFQNEQISIESLNQELTRKQQENFSRQEELELHNSFNFSMGQINAKVFNVEKLKSFQKSVIKQIEEYDFYKKNHQIKLKPIMGCENNVQIVRDDFYKNNNIRGVYFNLQSENTFSRNDKIYFKFRLDNIINSGFYVGITTLQDAQSNSKFWFSQGDQFSLKYPLSCQSVLQQKGDKRLEEVYKNGQIYELEFCVQENLMRISDESKQCVYESGYHFSQNNEEWVIIIGDYGEQRNQNCTIEIL